MRGTLLEIPGQLASVCQILPWLLTAMVWNLGQLLANEFSVLVPREHQSDEITHVKCESFTCFSFHASSLISYHLEEC